MQTIALTLYLKIMTENLNMPSFNAIKYIFQPVCLGYFSLAVMKYSTEGRIYFPWWGSMTASNRHGG